MFYVKHDKHCMINSYNVPCETMIIIKNVLRGTMKNSVKNIKNVPCETIEKG